MPTEVAAIIERASECVHFAGEFNGDRSERDAEINRTMVELACDTVKQDVEAMRARYPHLTALQSAIDDVDDF